MLLDVVSSVVEIGHGGHGVHGSGHRRRGDGLRFLDTGRWHLAGSVVVWDLREDKRVPSVHGTHDLLLRRLLESLVAIAATDGVTGVVATAVLILVALHLSAKQGLVGGDEGEPRGLELWCEQRGKDGRRAGVVGGETAVVVGLGHLLLGARDDVECLKSIRCTSQ